MYGLPELSYLTIGGYDKNDLVGNLTWYDTSATSDSWNITAVNMTINDINVNPSGDLNTPPDVNFQIGYPYMGFSKNTWIAFKDLMFVEWNPNIVSNVVCNSLENNEFCYWHDTKCSEIVTYGNFTIQLGDYEYSIPMNQFMVDVTAGGSNDCDVFIAELDANSDLPNENFVRLGDPFFASFLPVFDIDNDQIGLAMSARAKDHVSKTKVTDDDPPVEAPE